MLDECTLGSELLTTHDLGISLLSRCGQVSVNMIKPSYSTTMLWLVWYHISSSINSENNQAGILYTHSISP